MKIQLYKCDICAEGLGLPHACYLVVSSVSMTSYRPRLILYVFLCCPLPFWFLKSFSNTIEFSKLFPRSCCKSLHQFPSVGEASQMTVIASH